MSLGGKERIVLGWAVKLGAFPDNRCEEITQWSFTEKRGKNGTKLLKSLATKRGFTLVT